MKKKSTENYKGLPYITTLLSTSLWSYYGLLKTGGLLIVTVNGVGAALHVIYVALFLIYAPNNVKVRFRRPLFLINVVYVSIELEKSKTTLCKYNLYYTNKSTHYDTGKICEIGGGYKHWVSWGCSTRNSACFTWEFAHYTDWNHVCSIDHWHVCCTSLCYGEQRHVIGYVGNDQCHIIKPIYHAKTKFLLIGLLKLYRSRQFKERFSEIFSNFFLCVSM